MKKVLVGIDGSDFSTHALTWALDHLIQSDDEVMLVAAFQVPVTTVVLAPELDLVLDAQTDAIRDELRTASETMLRNVAEAHLEPRKIKFELQLEEGDARDVIPARALAEEVDVVVVGSHGKGAVKRLLLGSTSDAVVHNCTCPVLVVHRP